MIDRIKKTLKEATDLIKEQASVLGESAKEKSYQLIEDWVAIIPTLEGYGLKVTSFGLTIALNPGLEFELKGSHQDFSNERIQEILQENKGNTAITSVFTTIRTTYRLHSRIGSQIADPLLIKVIVKLTPQITVFIGAPEVH